MSSSSPRLGRVAAFGAAAALLGGGLLSGCGVSDEQLRPGVAAQVGDTEISLDEVEEYVEVACGFFTDEGQAGFPRSLARQQFLNVLVQQAAATQALEDAGVPLDPADVQPDAATTDANAQIPEDQRAPFALLAEASGFVDAAAAELGEASYAEEGEVPADPAVLVERGGEELTSWIASNDVEINPVFRLVVRDGQVVSDGGASAAQSEFAAATLLDPLTATAEEVAAVAERLPASQLCGAASEA